MIPYARSGCFPLDSVASSRFSFRCRCPVPLLIRQPNQSTNSSTESLNQPLQFQIASVGDCLLLLFLLPLTWCTLEVFLLHLLSLAWRRSVTSRPVVHAILVRLASHLGECLSYGELDLCTGGFDLYCFPSFTRNFQSPRSVLHHWLQFLEL